MDPVRIDTYSTREYQGYQLRPGKPIPFGATMVPGGANFSVYSSSATACTLVLFDKGASQPRVEIPFPEDYRIGDVWSMVVFGLDYENIEYGYRMDGPFNPRTGDRFDSTKILSDPYAKALGGEAGRPGYGSEGGRSSYGGESGRPGYGGESGRSNYGGESGRSSYGGDSGRSNYGTESGRSNFGRSDYNRPAYGDRGPSRYSEDRPPARPGERPGFKPRTDRPPRKNGGGVKRRPQIAPARPSQIEHLKTLLLRLEMSGEDLLRLAGKPLSMLNRKEAAELLTTCQAMLAERKPPKPKGKRQRPYLPESVDEHELVYLTEIQLDKRDMRLTLFNGEALQGKLEGFSPYALTLSKPDGQEITVQKLAIAYYETESAPAKEPKTNGTEEDD